MITLDSGRVKGNANGLERGSLRGTTSRASTDVIVKLTTYGTPINTSCGSDSSTTSVPSPPNTISRCPSATRNVSSPAPPISRSPPPPPMRVSFPTLPSIRLGLSLPVMWSAQLKKSFVLARTFSRPVPLVNLKVRFGLTACASIDDSSRVTPTELREIQGIAVDPTRFINHIAAKEVPARIVVHIASRTADQQVVSPVIE